MSKPAFKYYQQMPSVASIAAQLVKSNLLSGKDAEKLFKKRRPAEQRQIHPLEYLAQLRLKDASDPGEVLDLDKLCCWFASQIGASYYTIDPLKIDVSAVTSVMSLAYAQRHEILAVEVGSSELVIASTEPWNNSWIDNLRHVNRKEIKRVIANPEDIRRYTQEFYQLARSVKGASSTEGGRVNNFEQLLELGNWTHPQAAPEANDQHIVNIVDWLLQHAFEQRASDIHIEPRRDQCHLRFRIDGVLHLIYKIPPVVAAAITSRIKIIGRMNVAEKRKPQDGRLKTRNPEGVETELRLATMPTVFGEKLVMRIFDPDILVRDLSELGFSDEDEQRWRAVSTKPHGIVLVTGPTGSGKTTSLYSTLKSLATDKVNICTVEDPIEMIVPAFNQMQVQQTIDLGFATGLKALLRQDPDIIMVGEIRDTETAEMAVQAALTGHLVVSTMHTNDAPSALVRLMELGIPSYLIKASVLGVMAQRLVRTLCPDCKASLELNQEDWDEAFNNWGSEIPEQIYTANGCQHCRETGYRGRTGLYEILLMSDTLQGMLGETMDISDFRKQAMKEGMRSLRHSGAQKVALGLTTLEEVLRVTSDHTIL